MYLKLKKKTDSADPGFDFLAFGLPIADEDKYLRCQIHYTVNVGASAIFVYSIQSFQSIFVG